jgi:hypothetical protein
MQGFMLMAPAFLHGFVESPAHSAFGVLRANRGPDIRLALRPARSSDGDALQS